VVRSGKVEIECLDERLVRHVQALVAAPVQHECAFRVRHPRNLGREASFANARFARNKDGTATAAEHLLPYVEKPVELRGATTERELLVGCQQRREREGNLVARRPFRPPDVNRLLESL
jgi:hypothetical protein